MQRIINHCIFCSPYHLQWGMVDREQIKMKCIICKKEYKVSSKHSKDSNTCSSRCNTESTHRGYYDLDEKGKTKLFISKK